jgi:orotidine-5'-phosphate decarboxylase
VTANTPKQPPADLHERLILALDVPGLDSAKALVGQLGDSISHYKIGLELAMSGDYFKLMRWLLEQNKRVFADLKFHDIPATVGAAVRQLRDSGATLLTVHAERPVVEAAAENSGDQLRILAVTVLTSMSQQDLDDAGIPTPLDELVTRRAGIAISAGADGVVASGHEAAALRKSLGDDALIVTPGIRPSFSAGTQDQARVMTPRAAFERGASHIVVGRPIRGADDPRAAAEAIQAEIAAAWQ